ncbi:MAG: MmcQ/YjbR family DNA-binding protein [Clostridiales bacterium]|nr:MmcQ/YjbR family DNA-binding protein [Clostridiales bacterium]
MKEVKIKSKRIVIEKLVPFGFEKREKGYAYSETVLGGRFELKLFVDDCGKLSSQLIETAFDEEYVLHLVPEANGEFVGKVKSAYNAVLDRFVASCCETDVFQSEQAHAVIEYVRKTYNDELQHLWEKFPENAVFRRKDTQSWYAALLVISRSKLGFESDETVDIIDLRMDPEKAAETVDGEKYLPGYHMNKKHWVTVVLDGSVPTDEIFKRIDESYGLATKTKNGKKGKDNDQCRPAHGGRH